MAIAHSLDRPRNLFSSAAWPWFYFCFVLCAFCCRFCMLFVCICLYLFFFCEWVIVVNRSNVCVPTWILFQFVCISCARFHAIFLFLFSWGVCLGEKVYRFAGSLWVYVPLTTALDNWDLCSGCGYRTSSRTFHTRFELHKTINFS